MDIDRNESTPADAHTASINAMKNTTNHPGKIRPILQMAARMIKNDPTLLDDLDAPNKDDQLKRLRAQLRVSIPELGDSSTCPNCGASMAEYADTLDINDALLLYSMAKIVRDRVRKGIPFTEANRIRVSSEPIHHTQKCRTTKCSKLGLIARAGHAHWSITTRGYDALRGTAVPKVRVTFRGQILERPAETITFAEVFYEHTQKMKFKQSNGKATKDDKRSEFADYSQTDWVHINGEHQGNLL